MMLAVHEGFGLEALRVHEPLKMFFALTVSGTLYRVDADRGDGRPSIAQLRQHAWEPVDLKDGSRIDVMGPKGLICMRPRSGTFSKKTPDAFQTAGLVALFEDELLALTCQALGDRELCQRHWLSSTIAVYRALQGGPGLTLFVPPENIFFSNVPVYA